MVKLSLAIILEIIQFALTFEQTLITHTQGLFVCNTVSKNSFKYFYQDFQKFALNLLCSKFFWLIFCQ